MELALTCSSTSQTVAQRSFEDEGCADSEPELLEAISTADQHSQGLCVEATGVSFSLVREVERNVPICLAILVPPVLLEDHVSRFASRRVHLTCRSVWREEGLPKGWQPAILNQIHPHLSQQGFIRGMVLLGHSRQMNAAADIVLYTLFVNTIRAYHNVMDKLNGESMCAKRECIIKALPLSSISVANEMTKANLASLSTQPVEVPSCPVCLNRVDPSHLGLPKLKEETLCSQVCDGDNDCRNKHLLAPWPAPSSCKACYEIEKRWPSQHRERHLHDETNDVFCYCCALQETLWVCLICGFVGCGRYSNSHAVEHYNETKHAFSLELGTLRVWNYAKGEFMHRTDVLECPLVQRHHLWADIRYPVVRAAEGKYQATDKFNGNGKAFSTEKFHLGDKTLVGIPDINNFEDPPKKATMIGEEYEALLQSALEEQAQHYEGEITRLRAELTAEQVDEAAMSETELREIEDLKADIGSLRCDIDHLGRSLLGVQGQEAGHRAASQRLLREQGVAKDLLAKIREEAGKEHDKGNQQVEELEQQIADLTANLRMRHQFSQDQELSNAQIFGTTSRASSSKRGKKSRRGIFRNK